MELTEDIKVAVSEDIVEVLRAAYVRYVADWLRANAAGGPIFMGLTPIVMYKYSRGLTLAYLPRLLQVMASRGHLVATGTTHVKGTADPSIVKFVPTFDIPGMSRSGESRYFFTISDMGKFKQYERRTTTTRIGSGGAEEKAVLAFGLVSKVKPERVRRGRGGNVDG